MTADGSLERISGLTTRVKRVAGGIGSPPTTISTVGSIDRTVKTRSQVAELPAASARTISTLFSPSRQPKGLSVKSAPETTASRPPRVAVARSESATPVNASTPAASRASCTGSVVTSAGGVRSIRKKAWALAV